MGVTSTTHSSSGALRTVSWKKCLGSGVWNTGHFFNACSASSSMPTHTVTHLHLYCMHVKPINSVSNLCKPISDLCVEWFQMAMEKGHINGSKGFYCVKSFSGLKQKDSLSPKIFSPQAAKVSYYLCCMGILKYMCSAWKFNRTQRHLLGQEVEYLIILSYSLLLQLWISSLELALLTFARKSVLPSF